MLKKIGLIMVSLALLLGMTGCPAMFNGALTGGAAWNFDFEGTQWSKTDTDEYFTRTVKTYEEGTNRELTSVETILPVTENFSSLDIQKIAIGEDSGAWTYTLVKRFNSAFAGDYINVEDAATPTPNVLTDYSLTGTGSVDDAANVTLPFAEGNTYAGYAGAVLETTTVTGTWSTYKNDADEIQYIFVVSQKVTTRNRFDGTAIAGNSYTITGMALYDTETIDYNADDTANRAILGPGGYEVVGEGDDAILVDMPMFNAQLGGAGVLDGMAAAELTQ